MSQFRFLYYEAPYLKPGPEIQSWLITRKLAHERKCISECYPLSSIDRKVTYHEGENNIQTPGSEKIVVCIKVISKSIRTGCVDRIVFPNGKLFIERLKPS